MPVSASAFDRADSTLVYVQTMLDAANRLLISGDPYLHSKGHGELSNNQRVPNAVP